LADLLDWEAQLSATEYYDEAGQKRPLLMRHSQGDQWDLLVIVPMQSWTDYHSQAATQRRSTASAKHDDLLAAGQKLFAFYEDHFAYGPSWSALKSAYAANNFFHIEMFEAASGKAWVQRSFRYFILPSLANLRASRHACGEGELVVANGERRLPVACFLL